MPSSVIFINCKIDDLLKKNLNMVKKKIVNPQQCLMKLG